MGGRLQLSGCSEAGDFIVLQHPTYLYQLIREMYGAVSAEERTRLIKMLGAANPHLLILGSYDKWLRPGVRIEIPKAQSTLEQVWVKKNDPFTSAAMQSMEEIKKHVDSVEELRGAGIEIELPGTEPLVIRMATPKNGVETWVKVEVPPPEFKREEQGWWDRWRSTAISCGAFGFGVVATKISCVSTVATAGATSPLCVASYVGTAASGAQCTLAFAEATSDEFYEYLRTEDGQWINYVDIGLDFLSLGVGVASVPGALKSGSKYYQMSKYGKYLSRINKGKLIKTIDKLEDLLRHFSDLRRMLERGLKIANPAGKAVLTNNIAKRMLPMVMKHIAKHKVANLASVISASLSVTSSYYGGVGSRGWGLVNLEFYQFLLNESGQ